MKTKIDTEDYQATHGRKPQAREVAGWSFLLCREHEATVVTCPRPCTYAEARSFALSEARAIGGIVQISVEA